MSKPFAIAVYAVTIAFFAAFFVWPIAQILHGGFVDANGHFTLAFARGVFSNSIYLDGLSNAFTLGAASTLFAVLLGVPLALVADRCEFFGKKWLLSLVLLPLLQPPFVGAIGVRQILGTYGVLNTLLSDLGLLHRPLNWLGGPARFAAMIALTALSLYPIIYLNAVAALANLDPALEEAAENLGCRGFSKFFRITLPLLRPGLFAGGTVVFIWGFTELGVPLIFDYDRITSVQVYNGLGEAGQNPFPYALVTVLLVAAAASYVLGRGVFGRPLPAAPVKAGHASIARRPGWLGQAACVALFGGVIFLALLPHVAVLGVALASDWYGTLLPTGWTLGNFRLALGSEMTVPAIVSSLHYSLFASAATLVLGSAIAYVVARTDLPGRGALDMLAMLPLAVPGLVLASGYLVMSQPGRVFAFLDPVQNPTVLLIIAYTVRKLPLMVRAVSAGLEQTSVAYEEAAQNLGCPPLRALARITLPLIAANLLAGAIMTFAQSMLEVSDSMLLAQKQQYFPIAKAIYELMGVLGNGPFLASALGVWAMVFLGVTIYGASSLLGKKLGALFRL
jgi:iron(III) transport system permease protein